METIKNEHPILMSTLMIQAYEGGAKNQTRRLTGLEFMNQNPDEWKIDNHIYTALDGSNRQGVIVGKPETKYTQFIPFPYGNPGNNLWFRESWNYCVKELSTFVYKANSSLQKDLKWKPSIHMPRIAARFTPKIINYGLQRLHDITEEDSINEGIGFGFQMNGGYPDYQHINENGICTLTQDTARMSYASLWDYLNNKSKKKGRSYPFNFNSWVWVVVFERCYEYAF